LLVGAALWLLLIASPAVASTLPGWRVVGTIDHGSLTGLSCPSSRVCVAADSSGNVLESANPGRARSWISATVDSGHRIVAISCPAVSLCVGVDSSGNIVSYGQAGWQIAASGAEQLNGVSCPSVSLCVIADGDGGTVGNQAQAQTAGSVLISTDPAGGASTWSRESAGGSLGPECGKYGGWSGCGDSIVAVSCPSVALCVSADQWGEATQSTDPSRGAASTWSRSLGLQDPVSSLSCPSNSLCMASCPTGYGLFIGNCPGSVYYAGEVFTWNPTSDIAGRVLQLANDPVEISCPSAKLCFASDLAGTLWATSHPSAESWALVRQARSSNAADAITGIACLTSTSCVAVDQGGQLLAGGPPPTAPQLTRLLVSQLRAHSDTVRRATLLGRDGYRLSFAVPLGGKLQVSWRTTAKTPVLVAMGTAWIANAGSLKVRLRPTQAGRHLLDATHTAVTLVAEGTFTATRGPTAVARRTFVLSP